jgi:hypothetical protein
MIIYQGESAMTDNAIDPSTSDPQTEDQNKRALTSYRRLLSSDRRAKPSVTAIDIQVRAAVHPTRNGPIEPDRLHQARVPLPSQHAIVERERFHSRLTSDCQSRPQCSFAVAGKLSDSRHPVRGVQ